MTVKERCMDCIYLIAGENDEWLCSDCEYEEDIKPIEEVECVYFEEREV